MVSAPVSSTPTTTGWSPPVSTSAANSCTSSCSPRMNDNELRDLVERAFQIRELQGTQGWALLKDYVASAVNAKNRWLLNGNAKTIEEYRAEAGWVQGAMFVLEASERLDTQIGEARERMAEEKAAEG